MFLVFLLVSLFINLLFNVVYIGKKIKHPLTTNRTYITNILLNAGYFFAASFLWNQLPNHDGISQGIGNMIYFLVFLTFTALAIFILYVRSSVHKSNHPRT